MGLLLPTFSVVLDERPLGFAISQDGGLGAFVVSTASGAAAERGVRQGCVLMAVGEAEVASWSDADLIEHLRQVALPVRITFRPPVPNNSLAADDGPLVSSSGEEEEVVKASPPAAKRAREAARCTQAGLKSLEGFTCTRFDLGQPLGIFFDKACVAEKVGAGTQAAKLGVPEGARVGLVGGRRVASTARLVQRIQQAKKKGLSQVTVGYLAPPVTTTLAERPLPFSLGLDEGRGLFVVREVTKAARAQGIEQGFCLTVVGEAELIGRSEAELGKLLAEAALPLQLGFRRSPGAAPSAGDPELSGSSDAEDRAAPGAP